MIHWHSAKHVCFCACEHVPIGVKQQMLGMEEAQFLFLDCAGAARAKLCKARCDDYYAKALQVCARARLGGAQWQDGVH